MICCLEKSGTKTRKMNAKKLKQFADDAGKEMVGHVSSGWACTCCKQNHGVERGFVEKVAVTQEPVTVWVVVATLLLPQSQQHLHLHSYKHVLLLWMLHHKYNNA